MTRVVTINGSPRRNGNTSILMGAYQRSGIIADIRPLPHHTTRSYPETVKTRGGILLPSLPDSYINVSSRE